MGNVMLSTHRIRLFPMPRFHRTKFLPPNADGGASRAWEHGNTHTASDMVFVFELVRCEVIPCSLLCCVAEDVVDVVFGWEKVLDMGLQAEG